MFGKKNLKKKRRSTYRKWNWNDEKEQKQFKWINTKIGCNTLLYPAPASHHRDVNKSIFSNLQPKKKTTTIEL